MSSKTALTPAQQQTVDTLKEAAARYDHGPVTVDAVKDGSVIAGAPGQAFRILENGRYEPEGSPGRTPDSKPKKASRAASKPKSAPKAKPKTKAKKKK